MNDFRNSPIAAHLAKRVSSIMRSNPAPIGFSDTPTPKGLSEYLREHLASGETHYTTRPGLSELRHAIGREINRLGGPDRESDSVIVTQGEGEALYVTLLGLGIGAESIVVLTGNCAHRGLLDLLGIEVVVSDDPRSLSALAHYSEVGDALLDVKAVDREDRFEIVSLGGVLFSKETSGPDLSLIAERTIIIGHLDSLPGLDHFRMAYVAGPPDLVKQIQTWKQALSICSAAPSQRAAVFAISQERVS